MTGIRSWLNKPSPSRFAATPLKIVGSSFPLLLVDNCRVYSRSACIVRRAMFFSFSVPEP